MRIRNCHWVDVGIAPTQNRENFSNAVGADDSVRPAKRAAEMRKPSANSQVLMGGQSRPPLRRFIDNTSKHREEQNNHGTDQTAHALRVYGAASRAAGADGGDDGHSAQNLRPIWLLRARYAGDRGSRRAAGQGRRRNRKADLPLPEGRQRPGPSLRPHCPAGKIRGASL